jgi:hypothetical protein
MVSYERYLQLPVQSSNLTISLDQCRQTLLLNRSERKRNKRHPMLPGLPSKLPFLGPNAKPEHSFSAFVILPQD